jgi:Na+-transporting methylmalonyl-CoA/oxaloacetate decarboxylase gamma subunit
VPYKFVPNKKPGTDLVKVTPSKFRTQSASALRSGFIVMAIVIIIIIIIIIITWKGRRFRRRTVREEKKGERKQKEKMKVGE